MINFRDRKECQDTGIVTAMIGADLHPRGVVRKDGVWGFIGSDKPMTDKEQEYCKRMNLKLEGEKS